MKHLLIAIAGLLLSLSLFAQTFPSARILDLDLESTNSSVIPRNDLGGKIVIVFWATWNGNSKKFLDELADVYPEWKTTKGVKVTAVSIDDERNMVRVKPHVQSRGWEFEVFIDPGHELKRALNVYDVPYVLIIDGNGNYVWDTTMVIPGRTLTEIANNL